VLASNKRQALVVFRRALQNGTGAFGEVPVQTVEPGVEYINVYITARNIRLKEINAECA
jgi:hypothetical protein